MTKLQTLHDRVKVLIDQINSLTQEKTSNTIVFFENITITINFNSAGACYSELINWAYSLFIEVCGPNVKFFEERMKTNDKVGNYSSTPRLVHTLRTIKNHNLDWDKPDDFSKKNYAEEWYNKTVGKTQLVTDDDYIACSESILTQILEYLTALYECIIIDVSNEFYGETILPAWQRRNDRHFSNFDFEQVLLDQLQLYGIDAFLDTNKITKREIDKWRSEIKDLRDGFDFKIEAARIITRYILDQKYSPVDQKDLLDSGAEKGKKLMEIHSIIREEFYKNPRSKTELIDWAKEKNLL
ncbi:hypothetical protein [Chryseobacterium sp. SIMBA_038]|uniref:hypothetical protein n=1 Tax=Chryseobacterium sp. SIMBA_038 TaxID=3085780 RepID=UPI003979F39C